MTDLVANAAIETALPREHRDPPPGRRNHRRYRIRGLTGRVGVAQAIDVVDMSVRGARVRTGESLRPGSRYSVHVGSVSLSAEVVRCALVELVPDEDGGRPIFEAGLAFEPLTVEQRRELQRLAAATPLARRQRIHAA
jgi:PilZ domain-containing protein